MTTPSAAAVGLAEAMPDTAVAPAAAAGTPPARKPLLWLANAPWCNTGYGQQSAMFVPRIRDAGWDPAFVANYGLQAAILPWDGMRVYPGDHTGLAKYRLREYAEHFLDGQPLDDLLVVALMDAWTFTDVRFGGDPFWDDLRMACWVPIDHDPVPPRVLEALETLKIRPIAMSQFGRDRLIGEGFKDTLYVPHGVDTTVYQPQNRQAARAAAGIPDDAFVVSMVANNKGSAPSRKAFPQVFQAFSIFCREHPDARLFLHTDMHGFDEGVNLIALAQVCDIPAENLMNTDQARYHMGVVGPSAMARFYSMADVLINPSYGEGFGVPIIEAQACGTPVIVSNFTSMPELCGAGWLVEGDRFYNSAAGSFWMCPAVFSVYDALEQAYEARGDMAVRDKAVEFAQQYDADRVFDTYWRPALAALESHRPHVGQGTYTPLNRAQRRAALRAKDAPLPTVQLKGRR